MKEIQLSEREINCIEQVNTLITLDIKNHLSTEALALHVGINSVKLKYGFKQLYGTSIYQYLMRLRIIEAKELLTNKEVQVKVAALQCGFKNVQHFITCFKRLEKITPGRFQKNHLFKTSH